ncbi:MAG: VPLPA-CTERM sorting domain-containing protein [Gammaproteobacteria bacterium]
MWLRIAILFISVSTCLMAFAGTIPLQFYSTDSWTVVPYTDSNGEERATFFYTLDANNSFFYTSFGTPSDSLSGVLTVDVSQTLQAGVLANRIEVGFTQMDSNELTQSAFWDFSEFQILDGISLFASDEALTNGRGELHNPSFPGYIQTGNLAFGTSFTTFEDAYPFICIECGLDLYFDFLYMDWSTGQLQLNVDDDRTNIFYGQDFLSDDSSYGWVLNLSVQQVPLPAGIWFLLSALVFLGFRRPKK